MGIKKFKPTTPGRRHMTGFDFTEITQSKPHKSLTAPLHKKGGRSSSTGRMTIAHRGGGHKRKYRIIDFRRTQKNQVPAIIETIEYDPNRSARIGLLKYADGDRRYMLMPEGVGVGYEVVCDLKAPIKIGNRMQIGNMIDGIQIYNLELSPHKGGQIVRSAGSSATLVAIQGEYVQVRLPSGEVRLIHSHCYATIGVVSNSEHARIVIGKAGRNRWLGKRPTVRGKAKNVREHPHGSGEGGCPIGLKYPKTPWGKHALGVRTRKNKRTDKFIVSRRKK